QVTAVHSNHAFHNDHPLPVLSTMDIVHPHQCAAEGSTNYQGEGRRQVDVAHSAGSLMLREPDGDHVVQSREEPRLGRTENKTQDVEGYFSLHKHHEDRKSTRLNSSHV